MSYEANYYSSEVDGGIVAMILGMTGILLVICLAVAVLLVASIWKIFAKAGEEGWKAIIPFYNNYILYKIVWDTKFFFISLGLMVGMWVCLFGSNFTDIFSALYWACFLAGIIIGIMCDYKLAKSFGHGAGFTVGLIFFRVIFYPILGFGRARYLGKNQ